MKKQHYILMAILLSFNFISRSQTAKKQHPTSNIQLSGLSDQQKLRELVSINNGTYQLRVSNENYSPVLNLTLLNSVIASRQLNTDVVLEIDEFTRVFIPSTSTIENPSFVPLETIVYSSGSEGVGDSE